MTRRLVLCIEDPREPRTLEVRCEWCKHWHTHPEGSYIQRVRAPRGECYGLTAFTEDRGRAVEGEVFDTWTMPDWGCAEFEPKETPRECSRWTGNGR